MSHYRAVNSKGMGRKTCLHTSNDCRMLENVKGVRSVERSLFPDAPICSICSNTVPKPTGGDRSMFEALVAIGESRE